MQLITLDFETYFANDFSLSQKDMTTEKYVRDPRFKVHCVAIKGTRGARCVPDHENVLRNSPAFYWKDKAIIAHHVHFDGLILGHHYGIRPAMWFDTLSMARAAMPHLRSHSLSALAAHFGLPEKTVPYQKFKNKRELEPGLMGELQESCAHDVELTYRIFKRLLPMIPKEELRVIDMTVRMFTEPTLRLDAPRMQAELNKVRAGKASMLDDLGITRDDLHSAEKFADLLRSVGVEPPLKRSPSDPGKMIYAFAKSDDAMKELLEDDDLRVQNLAAARLGVKSTITETRCERLLSMASRGALPAYFNYCGAHTTRWSGGDKVNWQNFTRGSEMRQSIMAPAGYRLVVGDLSQIECRMLNWKAGQHSVLEAFRQSRDLYSEGASQYYGRTITKADKLERHLGKTIELGCGYGMGWGKFQLVCRGGALGGPPILLEDHEARRAVEVYRSTHPQVVHLWKYAENMLHALRAGNLELQWGPLIVHGNKIVLPNGAMLDYSTLDYDEDGYFMLTKRGRRRIYGAKLVENIIQALSRVVLSQAMLKIGDRYKIVLTCHDEVVVLAPEAEAQDALQFVLGTLKTPPAWCADIPLDAEGGHDVRYSK